MGVVDVIDGVDANDGDVVGGASDVVDVAGDRKQHFTNDACHGAAECAKRINKKKQS